MSEQPDKPTIPTMSQDDQFTVTDAANSLRDLEFMDGSGFRLDGLSVLAQVDQAREALAAATKVITRWRAKAVRMGHKS